MVKVKLIFVLIITLLFLSLVNAVIPEIRFFAKESTLIDIKETCTVGEHRCDLSYRCNISILRSDQTYLVSQQVMTNNTLDHYNFTINATDNNETGIFETFIYCTNGILNGSNTFYYEITPTGATISTPQGILYFLILGFALIIFGLSLYGSIKIPWKNKRSDEGFIIGRNDLKYVKLFLWFMTYMIAIWIFALGNNISSNFLYFSGIDNFFHYGYWLLMSFLFPTIVIFFIVIILKVVDDKKIDKAMKRGLRIK